MTNQNKILELKIEQLILQREEISRKIENLERLKSQIDSKINRLSEQRNKISQSENQNNSDQTDTRAVPEIGHSAVFSALRDKLNNN